MKEKWRGIWRRNMKRQKWWRNIERKEQYERRKCEYGERNIGMAMEANIILNQKSMACEMKIMAKICEITMEENMAMKTCHWHGCAQAWRWMKKTRTIYNMKNGNEWKSKRMRAMKEQSMKKTMASRERKVYVKYENNVSKNDEEYNMNRESMNIVWRYITIVINNEENK